MDSLKRVMGIETEYGISVNIKRLYGIDSGRLSRLVVSEYKTVYHSKTLSWDAKAEIPELDLRGFTHERKHEGDHYNGSILENGARYYVDCDHPEYSTPVCSNPYELLVYDKAGEALLDLCRRSVEINLRGGSSSIQIIKNNSDQKGNSYGCHENMMISRQIPFEKLVSVFAPLFASRQVLVGAGKFADETDREALPVFQISQRADFIKQIVGIDTMLNRPIINTRDEPHANKSKYRRLHIIIGDANMSEWCTYLKTGIFALVAAMLEDGVFENIVPPQPLDLVRAVRHFSRDTKLRRVVPTGGSNFFSALDFQEWYLERAEAHFTKPPEPYAHILSSWRSAVDSLKSDPRHPVWARRIDWLIKQNLLERYSTRKFGKEISAELDEVQLEKLQELDLQYHEVSREKGLYNLLVKSGNVDTLIADKAEVKTACYEPPTTTRSFFLGQCLKKFKVFQANWDSMVFEIDFSHCKRCDSYFPEEILEVCRNCETRSVRQLSNLLSVDISEPLMGTKAIVGELISSHTSTWEFVKALSGDTVELKAHQQRSYTRNDGYQPDD